MSEPSKSKCVICGKPQDAQFRPFCSKRCADVDLNRWFSGAYAIPAAEEDDPDEEAPPQA
ncbi:MAG: DNA gyrase inhibitor YacG [Hyphomonadaceae bacterium]